MSDGDGQGGDLQEIKDQIAKLDQDMGQRFLALKVRMDERFSKVDGQFAEVGQLFSKVDERFDGIDRRFDGIDGRFSKVDSRFDGIDERLDSMQRMTEAICKNLLDPAECRAVGVEPDPAAEGRFE